MTIEAGINGPIYEEAVKGLQRERGIEQGRELVPAIHTALNALMDDNVAVDASGRAVHHNGLSKITVYLNPDSNGERVSVNLARYVRDRNRRVFMNVFGLDTYIDVYPDRVNLRTIATVPQKTMASYESMRIPTGVRIPEAPPYEIREATLEEMQYIDSFVDVLYDPEMVERIGNKL